MDVHENIMNEDSKKAINDDVISMNTSHTSTEVQTDTPGKENGSIKESHTFTIKLHRKCKIRIYKPLISLKLALFFWYGAGSLIGAFLTIILKSRGMSLTEVSALYIVTPVIQTLGPVTSGIIADKLGRSKPVLVVNILLTIAAVIGLILMPRLNPENCEPQFVKLKCHHREFDRLVAKTKCDIPMESIQLDSCSVNCPEDVTEQCTGRNLICELRAENEDNRNFSLSVHSNFFYKLKSKCYYNVSSVSHKNESYSWCNMPHKMNCKINCTLNPGEECVVESSYRSGILAAYYVILVPFYTFFSNGYRFMDVTSMALVKEHNSDFGRERFFAIAGVIIFSPLSGYVVDATSTGEGEKNYDVIMYLFIVMITIALIVCLKLKVQINPPGKKMWKKTLNMAKNPDIVSFVLVVLVLGTAWAFTKIFMYWYLEELKAPSFLLGLLPAIAGLYGLPFLLTSNWWVNKIGPTRIFILGLLGYVISSIGFSFLYDPWISLCLEATCIFTYHLLWVAVITYSHEVAPEGMTATVISTAGGIHFSIGKGTGSLIGGLIMSAFGGRTAFRVIAIICFVCALLYSLFLYIRHRYLDKKRAREDKKIDVIPEEETYIYALRNYDEIVK